MKQRLDDILVQEAYAETLPEAVSLIMRGKVRVNGQIVDKAGTPIRLNQAVIEVKQKAHPYVSRGGVKLAHALDVFALDCQNAIAVDVGASTGGFTDCLRQHGASSVYAVDVGKNQLHRKLLTDESVHNWQGMNGRGLTVESFPEDARPTIGVTDVSFVSLRYILPPLCGCLDLSSPQTVWVVALLKPQFEASAYLSSSEMKAFDGVIREASLRERIQSATLEDLQALLPDWQLRGVEPSPIKGGSGNVEYITLWCLKSL
jgi:23S rRNA (cytidine1920-2'-O)/16S rRNA (cytidine1409-2'-O)-methyltransferase